MTYSILIALLIGGYALLAWRHEKHALVVLAALLPTYLLRFSLGPLPTTVLEACVVLSVAGWVLRGGLRHLGALQPYALPAGLLLVASVVSILIAPSTTDALGLWRAYIVEPIVLFAVLVTTFTERKDWKHAGSALLASGAMVAALGIVQRLIGVGIPAPWDVEGRITSLYDFPNAVGLFLAPLVAFVVVLGIGSTTNDRTKRAHAITAVLMLAAIILAQTEAALVAIPVALLLTLLVARAPLRTKCTTVAASVIVFLAVFALLPSAREKLLLNDISGAARTAMWRETAAMLADHPLTGAGLSGFPTAIAPYHDATLFEIFQYPHNIILTTWSELGLLGLLAVVLIAALACRVAWRHRGDPLVLAVFAALVTMLIHGLVDVPFFKNDLALLTAGLLAFLAWQEQKRSSASPRTQQ